MGSIDTITHKDNIDYRQQPKKHSFLPLATMTYAKRQKKKKSTTRKEKFLFDIIVYGIKTIM